MQILQLPHPCPVLPLQIHSWYALKWWIYCAEVTQFFIWAQVNCLCVEETMSCSEKVSALRIQCLSFFSLHPDPYRPMSLSERLFITCFPYSARWLKSTSSLMRLPIYQLVMHTSVLRKVAILPLVPSIIWHTSLYRVSSARPGKTVSFYSISL